MTNAHNRPPLPTLQSLRMLEAAVRLQSFSAAAEELGLTHGAVSRQVAALEDWTDERLFERAGRRMAPTEAARALVTQTREALRILEDAFGHPILPKSVAGLRVSTTSAIAQLWLIPRLGALDADHPGLVRAIQTSSALEAGWSPDIDAAIRYGPGGWPNVESRRLGGERLFPVAAAAQLKSCESWLELPLIATPYQSWRPWFEKTGAAPSPMLDSALELPDSVTALEAAKRGLGVALARERLAAEILASGALVRASEQTIEDIYAYYYVFPPTRASERVHRLGDWLAAAFEDRSI